MKIKGGISQLRHWGINQDPSEFYTTKQLVVFRTEVSLQHWAELRWRAAVRYANTAAGWAVSPLPLINNTTHSPSPLSLISAPALHCTTLHLAGGEGATDHEEILIQNIPQYGLSSVSLGKLEINALIVISFAWPKTHLLTMPCCECVREAGR